MRGSAILSVLERRLLFGGVILFCEKTCGRHGEILLEEVTGNERNGNNDEIQDSGQDGAIEEDDIIDAMSAVHGEPEK